MEIAFDGVIRKKSVGVVRHWRRFVETEFCTFTCRFAGAVSYNSFLLKIAVKRVAVKGYWLLILEICFVCLADSIEICIKYSVIRTAPGIVFLKV